MYNLSVDGLPEYFANGVLVHNCDALRYAIVTSQTLWRPYVSIPVPDIDTEEAAA